MATASVIAKLLEQRSVELIDKLRLLHDPTRPI